MKARPLPAAAAAPMALAVLLATSGAAQASPDTFKGKLSGAVEVPAVVTEGEGHARVRFRRGCLEYRFDARKVEGACVAANLHHGAPGENGPALALLSFEATKYGCKGKGEICGEDVADVELLEWHLREGELYLNVQTEAFPEGELRADLTNNHEQVCETYDGRARAACRYFCTKLECDEADFTPVADGCGPCKGGVTGLALRYGGAEDAEITVIQQHEGAVPFQGPVPAGGWFAFTGEGKKGTFGKEVRVLVDGVERASIHTSCSKPIVPGAIYGDLFEVLGGLSRKGGPFCDTTLDKKSLEKLWKLYGKCLDRLDDFRAATGSPVLPACLWGEQSCCQESDAPGCRDGYYASTVCAGDPACCTEGWDAVCALEVVLDAGYDCGWPGDCCTPHESQGCDDSRIAALVCLLDPYCCDTAWDEICAQIAVEVGADCGAP